MGKTHEPITEPSKCANKDQYMCVKAAGVGEDLDLTTQVGKCPKCGEPFALENVYFYKCKFRTRYRYWVSVGGVDKLFPDGKPYDECTEETKDGNFTKFKESKPLRYP